MLKGAASGGGAVRIVATSTTVMGNVSSNGAIGVLQSGGGSGGSILIQTRDWNGNGRLTANGGSASRTTASPYSYGGGGGGGRIAVHYSQGTFSGSMQAIGGSFEFSAASGGPGTIFVQDGAGYRKLFVNNAGLTANTEILPLDNTHRLTRGSVAWLTNDTATFEFDEINLTGNARLAVLPTTPVSVNY